MEQIADLLKTVPSDHPSPEHDIARLKAAIEDAKRIKDEFARLVEEMDKTLSRLHSDKSKDRPRRK